MGKHFSLTGARKELSPVDIVMGEDFGIVDIPPKMRVALLKEALRLQQAVGKSGGGGSFGLQRVSTGGLRRKPQAMVKLIRKGGTSDLRGMRDQMTYLRKGGDVALERSDRYFGTVVEGEAEEAMIGAWEVSGEGTGKADKTSHFVVSFPRDCDHDAAYQAGRAWAAELFDSGQYGDVYDYYTAFHTDRDHPHTHVVVNRRGIENEEWLKVSQRGSIDYAELRFVQVRVAAEFGVEMEATERVARGVQDRPLSDVEAFRAGREGRARQAPAHTRYSLLRTIALSAVYARQIEADAGLIETEYPKFAKLLKRTADMVRDGREIKALGPKALGKKPTIGVEEIRAMNEVIDASRRKIIQNFEKIDRAIDDLPHNADRTLIERQAARAKADAADFMPDNADLADYRKSAPDNAFGGAFGGAYEGIRASGDFAGAIKTAADDRVREIARRSGLDGDLIAARYDGAEGVPQIVADRWRLQDLQVLERAGGGDAATEKLKGMHEAVRAVYSTARRDIEAYEGRKAHLLRGLSAEPDAADLDRPDRPNSDVNDRFVRVVKETITTQQQRRLEEGDIRALSDITSNPDKQAELARRYLENEIETVEGARRGQLQQALGRVDRQVRLEADRLQRDNADRTRNRRNDDRDMGR